MGIQKRPVHVDDVAVIMKITVTTLSGNAPTMDFSMVANGKRIRVNKSEFNSGNNYTVEFTIPVENTHIPARDYQMDPTFAIMKGLNINTIDPVWSQFKIKKIEFMPIVQQEQEEGFEPAI